MLLFKTTFERSPAMASHLSMEERKRISELRDADYSRSHIARVLARAKSTISREIKRNRHGCLYCPVLATQKTLDRRRHRKLVRKMDRPHIAEVVQRGLKDYHSPDQIAGRMKRTISNPRNRISATTIYRWIHAQSQGTWDRYLRRFGKRRRGRKPSEIPGAAQIDGRPHEAEERAACGHWEGDTVWGGKRPGGLVALVDRKSRFVLVTVSKDRTARRIRLKVQKLLGSLPAEQRRSVTFDNGKEFAEHKLLAARTQMPVFFAKPYSPWQRGTCENTNGLLRQFFPKGASLENVSPRRVTHVARLLNHRPRKSLGYLTPSEVFTTQNAVAIEA
jgi:IS30 family transposase